MNDKSYGSGASQLPKGRLAYRFDGTTLTSFFITALGFLAMLLPLMAYANEHAANVVYRSSTELMPKAPVILNTPFDLARSPGWIVALGVVFVYLPAILTVLFLFAVFGSHPGIRLDGGGRKRRVGGVPVERVSRREFRAARKTDRATFIYPGLCWTMYLTTVAVWLVELIMFIYGALNIGLDRAGNPFDTRPGMAVFGAAIGICLLVALVARPTRGLAVTVYEAGQASVISMHDGESGELPPESGRAA